MAKIDLEQRVRKMQLTINNPDKKNTTKHGMGLNTVDEVKNYITGTNLVKEDDYYCFSFEIGLKEQTPHIHIFFCFKNAKKGKTVKKHFPTAHMEYCLGSIDENVDYVAKTGKWEESEKEKTKIDGTFFENKERPKEKGRGNRSDLDAIKKLIDEGKTPREILEINPNNYFFEKFIGEMYYNKRCSETPIKRDVNVVVHTGVAGSGKTNMLTKLNEQELFVGADYSSALFDNYEAQDILFLDEFRGQIPYNQLLIILDGYKMPIHARYYNKYALWNNVHITSVIPIEEWYNNDNIRDTFEQLKRRITNITYHFMTDCNNVFIPDRMAYLKDHKKSDIVYHEYTISSEQYTTYEDLEQEALASCGAFRMVETNDFCSLPDLTLDQEYEEWKKGNDPFNVLTEEQLFDMFWSEKVQKSKETVA